MASVTTQAEWMTHFTGKPVPEVEKLVCLDTPRGPVLFFVDKVQRSLQVVKPSPKGEHHLLNLSNLWKLKGAITSVTGTNDGKSIYIAFSKEKSGNDEKEDSLFATTALSYTQMDDLKAWENALISRSISPQSENLGDSAIIRSVVMGSIDTWGKQVLPGRVETYKVNYPDIVIHYEASEIKPKENKMFASEFDKKPANPTDKVSQIARAVVDPSGKTFQYEFVIMMNIDPGSKGVVIVPGICGMDRGVFASYMHRDSPYVTFLSFYPKRSNYPLNNSWEEGTGDDKTRVSHLANALQTVINSDGSTDLIATYEQGTRWHRQKDPVDTIGIDICKDACSGCRVAKAPEGNIAAVWMIKNKKELGYMRLDTKNDSADLGWTPIAEGEFSNLSPCINASDTLSRIMYTDSKDNIMHLEQTSTRIWNPQPFSIPDPKVIHEMTCYVCHVKLTANKLSDAANATVMLSSSSTTTVSVNGQILVVDSAGKPVKTDDSGKLEIINLTESLGTPSFWISNIPDKPAVLSTSPAILDPAKNVKVTLAGKMGKDDLKNAKNAKGEIIFPSDTDFDQLSTTLKDISKEMDGLPANGSSKPAPANPEEGLSDWAVFHWLKSKWGQVKKFFIKAGYFILEVAGKVFKFFVGCFEQALSAIQYAFGAVKAKLEDLRDFLGFLFNWKDIVRSQKSLVSIIKFVGTLDDSVIDKGFEQLDKSLETLASYMRSSTEKRKDDIVKASTCVATQNTRSSMDAAADKTTLDNEKTNPKASHTSVDYMNGKLTWMTSGAALDVPTIPGDTVDFNFFQTQINSFIVQIQTDLNNLKQNLALAFANGSSMSIGSILQQLGTTVVCSLITAFQGILKTIKSTFKAVYRAFFKLALLEIDIPFFSALYKKVTGSDSNPSMVDVIMLIAAIPITIILKLATGKSLPELTEDTFIGFFGKNGTGNGRTTRDVESENPLWTLYQTCMPFLSAWAQVQSYVVGVANFFRAYLVYQQFKTSAVPSMGQGFKVLYMAVSIFKIFTHVVGLPIIEKGEWDQTVMPTERFLLWSVECGALVFLDIYAGWYQAEIPAISPFISSVQTLAGVLVFIFAESIAINEVLFKFEGKGQQPAWTSEKTEKRKLVGGWWASEILVGFVASMVPPGVEYAEIVIKDPESRALVRAVGATVLGIAGAAAPLSLVVRGVYLGSVHDTMGMVA